MTGINDTKYTVASGNNQDTIKRDKNRHNVQACGSKCGGKLCLKARKQQTQQSASTN